MPLSMYQASAPVLVRALENLVNILVKGKAHALTKGTDEANYLAMRLIPDMLPLVSQVRIACDIAKRGVADLAGETAPVHADDETNFDQLIQRCQAVINYLKGFSPDQIDGSEQREIIFRGRGNEMRFTGQQALFGFVLANVHFHSSMAYALLRSAGVELGKRDYLGG